MRQIAYFVFSLSFALLTSCGSNNAPTPTQQPGSTPTATPQATPTPTVTATSTPGTQRSTSELSGTWAGRQVVLKVAEDGSMNVNFGCITADLPALSIDQDGNFSTPITAYYNSAVPTAPGDEQSFDGTLSGQVSGNKIQLNAVLNPPHPRPSTSPDTVTDTLNRGQTLPTEHLLCAMPS